MSTTTTTLAPAVDETTQTPPDHHKRTHKARYVGPPAIEASGTPIPYSKRWGYSPSSFTNTESRSLLFVLLLMILFTTFNQSHLAHRFYSHLSSTYTPFQVNFYGTFAVTTIVYFGLAAVFAIADLTGQPRELFKYKVQPFQRIEGDEYAKIAWGAARNHLCVAMPLAAARAWLTPAKVAPQYVEGPAATMANLVFNFLCTEVGFYFIHRFFHTPWMYQRFHKQHHYMTAPVAISSSYCTMVEHAFSNLLPNALGTAILKPHWSVQTCTFCILAITTLCAHSGYNIPWLYGSLQHDYHHFAFNENYGPTGLLDGIFGTSRKFKEVMRDARERNGGDGDKAREEMLSRLARWESAGTTKEL